MNNERRRVVITGLGPVASMGEGVDAFWEGLLREKGGVGRLTRFDPAPFHAKGAAEIFNFDPLRYISTQRLKRMDRHSQLSVASALLALQDAGISWDPGQPRQDTGISLGTALGGISDAEEQHEKFLSEGMRRVRRSLAMQIFGGAGHSNVAIECGFQGPATTNSNSCASGAVAIGDALQWIRYGWVDRVVAGGAEAPLSPLTFGAFDVIRTMSRAEDPSTAYRPFDRRRDGFVMGEGAACLMLEEYGSARRRNARIYAEVMGYALSNDAYHMTSPRPDGDPVTGTIRKALEDAGVHPDEIDYINAHASATPMNDANEVACLHRVFGDRLRDIPVSGTKPYMGHTLGAAGALEAVICALSIKHGYVPPTLHCEELDPACDIDFVPRGRRQEVRRVLSNSFGFGGINACLVFGKVEDALSEY